MRTNRRCRKIQICFNRAYNSGRELIRGIVDFTHNHTNWQLEYLDPRTDLARLGTGKVDGLITSECGNSTVSSFLASSDIPTVVVGIAEGRLAERKCAIAYIRNDDQEVGRHGAEYLTRLGNFASYGFLYAENPESYCARLRRQGFRRHLSDIGRTGSEFAIQAEAERSQAIAAIADWLGSLEHPSAVMAYTDDLASLAIAAANAANIKIPEEISILGVDNDDTVCIITSPQLSSVAPNHFREGSSAAGLLNRLIVQKGRRSAAAPRELVLSDLSIIERGSTHQLAPGLHLAKSAMAFITANFTRGITVNDVVARLRVSRRLADLRFREFTGKSIYAAINEARLGHAAKLLRETSQSVSRVFSACGFPNENSARILFRNHFDATPAEFRDSKPRK